MTWPLGSSEMAARIRTHDWAATPLGPTAGWPTELRHTVELLLEHPLPMALLWGPDAIQLYNDDYARVAEEKHPGALGRPLDEIWPESRDQNALVVKRVHAGEPVLLENLSLRHVRRGRMQDNWYMAAHSPVRTLNGDVVGILITIYDKTGEKEAESRLREAEEIQAFLLRFSDTLRSIGDPIEIKRTAMRLIGDHFGSVRSLYVELGPDSDILTEADCPQPDNASVALPMHISDFGRWKQAILEGRTVHSKNIDQDARLIESARNMFRSIGGRAFLGVPLRKAGPPFIGIGITLPNPVRWRPADVRLLEEVAERISDAVDRARGEAALRASEEGLRRMVAELQHRVRNILTVVRSVFTRTFESSRAADELADHFRGRLDALARTQVMVSQTAAGTADLENLIRDELMSVGVCDGAQVRISGPDVLLSSHLAESIGLAIHELTTNSVKFGALKSADGGLDLSWTVTGEGGGRSRLDLEWQEQGVPAIPCNPARGGFGRDWIEEGLPYQLGAETSLEFRGGGVRCSISVMLDSVAADDRMMEQA